MMKMSISRRVVLVVCLLIAIFISSFLFRLFLLTRNRLFPPGADIAQHATYVNLILMFHFPSWNPYHMAGEPIVRPLLFHYLASLVSIIFQVNPIFAVLYTGLFFSALTPVTVYFFIKRLTASDKPAFLCAGFYGLNLLDVEMLSWGGYPNVVGLALIPLIFYFFLGTSRRSKIAVSLLIPVLSLIDHSSFLICVVILGGYIIFLLMRRGFRGTLSSAMPFLVGIVISIPYLVFYGARIYLYTLITRQMPVTFYALSNVLPSFEWFMQRIVFLTPFFLLGVFYSLNTPRGRFLLFWAGMPIVFILGYLFGFYVTYYRLIYFTGQAIMIFVGLGSYFFSISATKLLKRISCRLKIRVRIRFGTIIVLIAIGSIFLLQVREFYQRSVEITDFYQIVKEDEYEALEWIIGHTEETDVFVSEHTFGWWINGYAQRPCLWAIPFENINLPWQIEKSLDAYKILYQKDGYIDLMNKYDVKYVVLHFGYVFGLSPSNKTEVLELFENNSDFRQIYPPFSANQSSIFIFEVENHGWSS